EMNEILHLFLQRPVGAEYRGHRRAEPPRGLAEDGGSKPVLGAEVVVQECLVHAGRFRYLLHPGTCSAAPHEHPAGGFQDPPLRVAVPQIQLSWALIGHFNCPVKSSGKLSSAREVGKRWKDQGSVIRDR